MPNAASQMRVAFASMALKTGASSPGELADDFEYLGRRRLLLQRLIQPALEQFNLLVSLGGGRLATDLRRIAARQRLRALRFWCFAACFVAPSHLPPPRLRTGHRINPR